MKPTQPIPLELRVLQGEQRGACVPLAADAVVSVSGQPGSDIVLRDVADAALVFELRLHDKGIEVKTADGKKHQHPWLRPLELGGAVVAVGPVGDTRWAALLGGGASDPAATAEPDVAELPPRGSGAKLWARRLVFSGAALAGASLSMIALAVVIAPREPGVAEQAHRAQALLRSAGLTAVSVAAENNEIVVSGYLDTLAQRTKAEQLLAQHGLQARMGAWVNETVTLAVRDVYRVQGVQADVQSTGPGAVRVRTTLANPAALADIEKTVRRDVQGLSKLEASNEPPPRTASPVPALDDPGKRVASIVAGDDPYVVTIDGNRYFVGAMLPTGHRILGIDGSKVQLEREGVLSAVAF
jgi:type III secretion protein D